MGGTWAFDVCFLVEGGAPSGYTSASDGTYDDGSTFDDFRRLDVLDIEIGPILSNMIKSRKKPKWMR